LKEFPLTGNIAMGFDEDFDIFNPNDRQDFYTDINKHFE